MMLMNATMFKTLFIFIVFCLSLVTSRAAIKLKNDDAKILFGSNLDMCLYKDGDFLRMSTSLIVSSNDAVTMIKIGNYSSINAYKNKINFTCDLVEITTNLRLAFPYGNLEEGNVLVSDSYGTVRWDKESDPSVNDLGKAELPCANGQITKWNGTKWVCDNSLIILQSKILSQDAYISILEHRLNISESEINTLKNIGDFLVNGSRGYYNGSQGSQGIQGAQGAQGAQGIQGDTGPQGPIGPQGVNRTNGNGHSLDAADGNPVDALFVDNSGNIGIGTTTPAQKLSVVGTIESTGASGGFIFPDATIQSTAATPSQWISSASNIYFDADNGNVGIGSAIPTQKLDVVD